MTLFNFRGSNGTNTRTLYEHQTSYNHAPASESTPFPQMTSQSRGSVRTTHIRGSAGKNERKIIWDEIKTKMDKLQDSVEGDFENLRDELNAKIHELEKRCELLESRIERNHKDINDVRITLGGKIDGIFGAVKDWVNKQISRVEATFVEKIDSAVNPLEKQANSNTAQIFNLKGVSYSILRWMSWMFPASFQRQKHEKPRKSSSVVFVKSDPFVTARHDETIIKVLEYYIDMDMRPQYVDSAEEVQLNGGTLILAVSMGDGRNLRGLNVLSSLYARCKKENVHLTLVAWLQGFKFIDSTQITGKCDFSAIVNHEYGKVEQVTHEGACELAKVRAVLEAVEKNVSFKLGPQISEEPDYPDADECRSFIAEMDQRGAQRSMSQD